jgi:aminopeptidase-like protein
MKIISIVKKIFPYNYSITGPENNMALKQFLYFLPFKIHSFRSSKELNGWKIPKAWKVIKANLKYNDKLIYDGKSSPFGVPTHSNSFSKTVDYKELIKHIYYSETLKKAIPYNWTGLYRKNTKKSWGFCMTKEKFLNLKKGKYYVDILTKQKNATMKVLEYTLRGKSNKTIIINAHNCHPYQANDDISGCAVGIKIFKRLQQLKNRKFTYKLLIAPELTGPVFWLNKQKKNAKNIKYAILLKSVGNKNQIKLQKSYKGNTDLDSFAEEIINKKFKKTRVGNFREIYGNDETVFDSPGYNIPSISITRYPFKEYHTNFDLPKILSEERLQEIENYVIDIIKRLELYEKKNLKLRVNFKGLISLSNPKYNLYLKAKAPGIDKIKYKEKKRKWNLLMNCLPNDIENSLSIREIAKKYKLPNKEVLNYCNKWIERDLLKKL